MILMGHIFLLAQTQDALKTGLTLGDWILQGGVPAVLLVFLGVVLYALKKMAEKNEALRIENVELHRDFTKKVEQLMERIVETNSQLVLALEKSAQQTSSIEAAIKNNEELLTTYRAELALSKRQRSG